MRISDNRWCTRAVYAKKIWHCPILLCHSKSVRCTQVINWKSMCIVLCYVQHAEICTEQRTFADNFNFLSSFEENRRWIIPITSRSLWWTWSIARFVWTMVSMFQKRWFRHTRRRKTRNMENRQNNSKMWNCKHCWTKMILKHENNSASHWALVNKLFPIGYKRWERFKRPIDGYKTSWTTGKWKSAKTRVRFCSLRTKGSCIVTGDEKWIHFENP